MIISMLSLLMQVSFGAEVLISETRPVPEDPTLIVATYYTEEPQSYFFTIVYSYEFSLQKYFTKLTFEASHASLQHEFACQWAKKTWKHANLYHAGLIPLEPFEICPFQPPGPARKRVSFQVLAHDATRIRFDSKTQCWSFFSPKDK